MMSVGLFALPAVQPDVAVLAPLQVEVPGAFELPSGLVGRAAIGAGREPYAELLAVSAGGDALTAVPFGAAAGISRRGEGEQQARGNEGFHVCSSPLDLAGLAAELDQKIRSGAVEISFRRGFQRRARTDAHDLEVA